MTPPQQTFPEFTATTPDLRALPMSTATNNKLYGKLRDELIGPKGELLTSAVEWKTSLDMISGRARQVGSAFLAVRKLQFIKAAKILNISVPSKIKNLSKKNVKAQGLSVTSLWLEYWMGWAPCIGDIAHAINVLTEGPSVNTKHFRVAVEQVDDIKVRNGDWSSPSAKTYYRYERHSVREHRFAAYGDVLVTNHNKQLANQLGFTNPAVTLWQVLPFSFMVDWFSNVGTVLGSLTDFESLDITNTGRAMRLRGTYSVSEVEVKFRDIGPWPYTKQYYYSIHASQDGWSEELYREPGSLPTPRLNIKMLDRLSLTRAATSISLLREIFLRK